MAAPEKAILDQLYAMSSGSGTKELKDVSNTKEWSLLWIDKKRLLQYSKKFPKAVQIMANELIKQSGSRVVTIG